MLFGLEALKGSIYFNSTFLAVADVIGYAIVGCTLNRYRRRVVIQVCMAVSVIASFAYLLPFVKIPKDCSPSSA